MKNLFSISKGLEISKLGKKYLWEGQCDWSKCKKLSDVGKMCIHHDCLKSFYINLGIEMCRKQLLELTNPAQSA